METDNFRVLLYIRRMDRVPNALIREFCRVTKGVDERIYASILLWFVILKELGMTELLIGYKSVCRKSLCRLATEEVEWYRE